MKHLLLLAALAAPSPSIPTPDEVLAIASCRDAIEILRQIESAPNSPPPASAVESASRCIEQGGGADGLIIRAQLENALKKQDAAISDLSDALKRKPFSDIALFDRGLIWLDRNNYDAAISDFTGVIH